MSASAVPAYVKQFGVKAGRVLPKNCTTAVVDPSRRTAAGTGVWVGYGPNANCARVFAFHEPLARVKSVLTGRAKHGTVRHMKIGGRSVTAIGPHFVWRQDGMTYDVRAKNDAGVKRLIASFR